MSKVTESGIIVIDTPDGIRMAQMLAQRGALKLEIVGMKRRGRSAYAIIKEQYGFRGDRISVYHQLCELIGSKMNAAPGGKDGNSENDREGSDSAGIHQAADPTSPCAPHIAAADIHGGEE